MKKGLLALLLISGVAQAKNLGTWGEMYPIAEQDMLTTIQTRLKAMEASGEMAREQEAFKQRVIENTLRPKPVTENTASTAVTAEGSSASTGGTERDIEQDLPQDMPPGLNSDGEVVDFAAYEAWAQTSHQTRDMTRREEVNINHATDKTHDFDDDREVF